MSTWSFVLSHGGDITALVDVQSIVRTRRLFTELVPNTNRLDFRAKFNESVFASLLANDIIEIAVTKDGAAYFTGVLSPNYKTTIRDGQRYMALIAEDYTQSRLGQTVASPFACAGFAVCTPAATATSLVHAIATQAGVTLAASLPTISSVVPYVVALPDDKTTWGALLAGILFEYGYVYQFDSDGKLSIPKAVNTGTITTTATLTTAAGSANIRGELEIEKSPERYDDIRIKYDLVELKTGIVLFQDTTGGTEAQACTIPLAATGDAGGKDFYPLTSKIGEVFSTWKNPDGYDIWVATTAALDATFDTGIAVDRALSNYYRKCSFSYKNTTAGIKNITKLRITGNAYVVVSKNTARSSIASAKKLYEYESKYLFNDTDAATLANALAQYYLYSDIKYVARSKDVLDIGEYVLISDAIYSGLSTKCRVVGIVDQENASGVIKYELEGVADFNAITIDTEGEGVPNTVEVINSGVSLSVSPGAIVRDRAGVLSPPEVEMSGKYRSASDYSGRFTVEVSGDGLTYHEHYKSITDEASHTFEVPAKTNVPDCQAYYPADDVSPYPDDPAGTTYLQDEWATVDVWIPSASATISVVSGTLHIDSTGADPYIARTFTAFSGATNRTIRLKFDGPQGSALGVIFFSTTGHGYSGSYYKIFTIPLAGGIVDLDMGTLTVGGTDWITSSITGVRIDTGSASGQSFVIDFIYIGTGKYLDGSLQNQISDSYDGTIYGCVPDGAGGLIFDGINDYVEIPSPWAVDSVSKDITLCAVINVPSAALTLTYPIFDTWKVYATKKGFILRLATDKRLQFYNPQSGADNGTTIGSALSTGIHVILAVLSDGQTAKFYDNGVLIGSGNSLPIVHSGAPLWIGKSIINNGYANNVISNPRWFPRALTALEVLQLYNDPTDPAYYTVDVRTRLYASGGFTTRIGEAHTTVAADPSTAAEYLGIGILTGLDREAYTSATVDEDGTITVIGAVNEVFAGDTVVNYSSSGGVATLGLYKWSGTAWVKTTNIKDLTLAMNDLFGLSVAGISIADATVVSLLIAKQILAENVDVTGQLTVQAGGRMRYETGAGVQKRCVQLADEKIDWLDTPDTTPASAEQLRFRLGRLGVGGAVLADGELLANITSNFSSPAAFGSAGMGCSYRIDENGDLWFAINSYERKLTNGIWGAETSMPSGIPAVTQFAYFTLNNANGVVFFYHSSLGNIYRSDKVSGAWSTPALVLTLSGTDQRHVSAFENENGDIHLFYCTVDVVSASIYECVDTGSGFGSSAAIASTTGGESAFAIRQNDSTYRLFYVNTSSYLAEKVFTNGSWGAENVVLPVGVSRPTGYHSVSNNPSIIYKRLSDNFIASISYADGAWGAQESVNNIAAFAPVAIVDKNGNTRVAYSSGSIPRYHNEVTRNNYARVGAGIISDTNNGTTRYLDFSNNVRLSFPVGGGSVTASIL